MVFKKVNKKEIPISWQNVDHLCFFFLSFGLLHMDRSSFSSKCKWAQHFVISLHSVHLGVTVDQKIVCVVSLFHRAELHVVVDDYWLVESKLKDLRETILRIGFHIFDCKEFLALKVEIVHDDPLVLRWHFRVVGCLCFSHHVDIARFCCVNF